jgi:hypothetical protein
MTMGLPLIDHQSTIDCDACLDNRLFIRDIVVDAELLYTYILAELELIRVTAQRMSFRSGQVIFHETQTPD